MSKYRCELDLQLFAEEGEAASGVEDVPAAGEQTEGLEDSGDQTGVEEQAAAELGSKQNNFEKAFAKRLAAERAKWESEYAEKYKDYDTHKRISEFFQSYNGMDAMTLAERVEMERLQEQADKQQVPVEVMRRLQELEAKAAQADTLAEQQRQAEWERSYGSALEAYAKERDVDAEAINKFLVETNVPVDPQNLQKSFDLAYKAIQFEALQAQLADAEKTGMKKLLGAKTSVPNISGNGAQGQTVSGPPKTFAEARARAMQRMSGE